MKGPIVFFDLETGGLAPTHADIQVAAIAVSDWKELSVFERKIQFPPEKAEAGVLAMNSYDPAAWERDAKPEAQVVAELGRWLKSFATVTLVSKRGNPFDVARLAGHNALGFDGPRLARMFERHHAFLPASTYQPLDTMQLALWTCERTGQKPTSYKLGDLCQHFGVRSGKVCVRHAAEEALREPEVAASPYALRVETKTWLSQHGWRPHEPYARAADLLRRWLAEAKP